MKHRISPSLAISLIALFFSLTGAGFAATGYRITSIWQISPKVRHALRGHRGERGPAGQPGAPGPPGAQGPAGPAGIVDPSKLVFRESLPVRLDPTGLVQTSVTADCPPGYFPLNGGYITPNPDVVLVIADWQPPQTNVWDTDAMIAPDATSGGTIQTWANCAPAN